MKKQEYGLKQAKAKKSRYPLLFPVCFLLWGFAFMSYSTQTVARALRYHPDLGKPVFDTYYLPWKVFEWNKYIIDTPVGNRVDLIFGVFVLSTAFGFFLILRKKPKGNLNLHGTATWAKKKELPAMGLDAKEGVYVGGFPLARGTKYLIHNGPEHILAFAPTRSGKGVGLVIPSLLAWPGSSVTLDIKGENYALTSGYRAKELHHKILKFDPADETFSFAKWNPLAEVRINTNHAIADAQNIAQMICDPDGKGMKDYFTQAGYALLTGLILHVIVSKQDATLADVVAEITKSDNEGDVKNLLYAMIDKEHAQILKKRYPDMDTDLADNIQSTIDSYAGEAVIKADRELSGVVSTAVTNLSLYRDPIVAKNTSESDFFISDIMNSQNPVDLYLVVSPANLDRLRPLLRVFFNLALRKFTQKMEFKNGQAVVGYKHRLLLMLDEFTSLGKLEIMQKALAFMAGYGVKAYIIVQDLSQLQEAYTRDESITSNCHVRIAYAPNKIETAKLLSDMTGKTTVVDKKTSVSGKRLGGMGNASVSISEVARPLLTPDECMRLKGPVKDEKGGIKTPGDMLIFVAGYNTVYGQQILYFLDPVFQKRVKTPPPDRIDLSKLKEVSNNEI
nr:type IV secretory system conjugative DNA transfer family protein [uncultured Desulfobacter sp.]